MTSCSNCETAIEFPTMNEFTAHCVSCKARALAAIGGSHEPDVTRRLFGDALREGVKHLERWESIIRAKKAQKATT